MHFEEVGEIVTFYIWPLPPTCYPPTGAHLGHPGNCHEQLLFFTQEGIYTLHSLTVLYFWIWKLKEMLEIYMVTLGILVYVNNGQMELILCTRKLLKYHSCLFQKTFISAIIHRPYRGLKGHVFMVLLVRGQ